MDHWQVNAENADWMLICMCVCVCVLKKFKSIIVMSCFRMVGNSKSAQSEIVQREVESRMHDVSSAERHGGSVRR